MFSQGLHASTQMTLMHDADRGVPKSQWPGFSRPAHWERTFMGSGPHRVMHAQTKVFVDHLY